MYKAMAKVESKTKEERKKIQKKTVEEITISYNPDNPPVFRQAIKKTGEKAITSASPISQLEFAFYNYQRGKGNSEITIEDYRRGIHKFYEFLTWELTTVEEYKELINREEKHGLKPEVYYGGRYIILALDEMGDIEAHYLHFLTTFCKLTNMNTILHYMRAYRAFMYYGMKLGVLNQRKIELKEAKPVIHDCYTDEEVRKLLRKPKDDNFTSQRDWVMVNYLMSTGNRCATIIALNVGDIDFDNGLIKIRKQKSGEQSLISMPSELHPILWHYINDYRTLDSTKKPLGGDVPLFPNWYGNRLTDDGLKKAIARYNNSRGVDKTSIHLFRHTFAKRWIMSGGDILSLQIMLGQSSLKMVQHYANMYGRDIKEKVNNHAMIQHFPRNSGKTIKKQTYKK